MPRSSCRTLAAAVLLAVLSLWACSAPPSPPPVAGNLPLPRAHEPAAVRVPPKTASLCAGSHVVPRAQLAAGPRNRPFDVVVTAGSVWVLAEPARLLRVARADGSVETVAAGAPEEVWTAMDADPRDGSIWIAAPGIGFVHVAPDLTATRIRLQHAVEGKSAYVRRLVVATDSLYVQPFCSDRGVWRVGRDGKPLGTAFPAPQTDPRATADTMDCSPLRLERGPGGRILAYDPPRRALFALAPGGEWRPAPGDLFAGIPAPPAYAFAYGASTGDRHAVTFGRLVDWKGRPVFLGHPGEMPIREMAFFPLGEGGVEAARPASCGGVPVRSLATGAGGYAALLADDTLLYGELADAPELP